MKVLLDTNFMLIPFQFKIDIFDELQRISDDAVEIYTLNLCLLELKEISPKNYESVLELLKLKKVKIRRAIKVKTVDDTIVSFAKGDGAVVCTQDKILRSKCKKKGVACISMRAKKYLDFV